MITKERKRELKKMYLATQTVAKIQTELAHFFIYLKGWTESFPEESENDIQLFDSLSNVIEQHEISFDISLTKENMITVNQIKEHLVLQHYELAKVLSAMTDCGLSSLPSWNPDTWIIGPIVNLFTDLGYVLEENDLEAISL